MFGLITDQIMFSIFFVGGQIYGLTKYFSTLPATNKPTNKVLLTKLRKSTGYPFTKCSEALKLFSNNLEEAEKWLHEQAEKEGWLKAQKLKERSTSEGLVGVLADENFAALVEVCLFFALLLFD